jgi:hypothetical protein
MKLGVNDFLVNFIHNILNINKIRLNLRYVSGNNAVQVLPS